MKSAKRAARRRRSLRKNPLSTRQKALGVGGVLAIGGVAAYALMSSSASAQTTPPPPPGSAEAAAAAALGAQCAAMQATLVQMRAATNPDMPAQARLEAQIANCIAQAREAGAPVDNAMSNLSDGDTKYQQIQNWYAEYKGTEYSDALKRNNIRREMLTAGEAMANSYAAAVPQAADAATSRAVRLSILRALDAAFVRQLCYLYDQPGCGRFGLNEDHGADKAAQELSRVIQPLLNAQSASVQKVGYLVAATDNALLFSALLMPATAANTFANAKFSEYCTVDYADVVRRNNLRQEVLAAGRSTVAALRYAIETAIAYGDLPGLRSATNLLGSALSSAIGRWLCYLLDQQGCGRFGLNEDDSLTKAAQEHAATVGPMTDLYMTAAARLVRFGDVTAYEPLVALKVSRCTALNAFVNTKFNEYKTVSWSDAVRRNNLRVNEVLGKGRMLAACLQDAMATALTGAAARPDTNFAALLSNTGLLFGPITVLSGLGAAAPTSSASSIMTASQKVSAPISATSMVKPTPPTPDDRQRLVQDAIDAGVRMVKSVMVVAKTALDAAISRQLCYLYDKTGCGRFGVNEDDNSTKASQEYAATVAPMMAVVAQGTTFLVGKGDPKAETALITSKLMYCTALNDYVNAKFAEYKTVSWTDAVRRNNLRINEVLAKGRALVQCLRDTAPTTPDGRALVRAVVESALSASRARVACYNSTNSADGCGRFAFNEDDNATKAAQETKDITAPLADLSSRLASGAPLSGLGDVVEGGITVAGVAAVLGGLWLLTSMPGTSKVKRNRKSRRTSRRAG
jgi:hypothetical protein